jgi:hypothetical protein
MASALLKKKQALLVGNTTTIRCKLPGYCLNTCAAAFSRNVCMIKIKRYYFKDRIKSRKAGGKILSVYKQEEGIIF